MLSLRLKEIAKLIDNNSRVIDVGCDHGLLDIYLASHKKCYCLATDISKESLKKAQANVLKSHLDKQIKTMVTNGLEKVDYQSYDYVVISGMGTNTIQEILDSDKPNKIIIQSNNNIEQLRHFLFKDYVLKKEKIVFEKNICYVIMLLEKGKKSYCYRDYLLGLNYENQEYIDYLRVKNLKIYHNLPMKYIKKRWSIKRKISILNRFAKKNK